MYLSVIIPAYNEERRIEKTLLYLSEYLEKQDYSYEIIVINDGSKDKTSEVVLGLQNKIKNLKLIDNKKNSGKGAVVREAMLKAEGDYRLFTDADNSTPIEEIEKMMPFKSDIIIGSRTKEGAIIKNPQPLFRIFVGKIFNLMVQIIVGLFGVWDTQCGFKCISKRAVEDIFPRCKIDRWAFDPEILKIGKLLGYEIKEIPITWTNDIESKVKSSAMIKMAIDLFKIRWNLITKKYGRK